MEAGKAVFLGEEHAKWLSSTRRSALKTDTTSNNIRTEQVIFRSTYVYTYMHFITISGKRGHELEGEWRMVYGTVWREERGEM